MSTEKERFIKERRIEEEERRGIATYAFQKPSSTIEPNYEKEWEEYLKIIEKGMDSFLYEIENFGSEEEKFLAFREINSLVDTKSQLSHELINLMYSCAKRTIRKNPQKAASLFHILSLLVPNSYDIWIGYGRALQGAKMFSDALRIYEKAESLNHDHPLHLISSGECFLEMNDRKEANQKLNVAKKLVEHEEKYHKFQEELKRVLSRL